MTKEPHDVTRDPLSPEMRRWVDKAAEEVVAFALGAGKLSPPPEAPYDCGPKPGQALTPLERRVEVLQDMGWDDSAIMFALEEPPQVVGKLISNIRIKRSPAPAVAPAPVAPPEYSPLRRFDEAD